MPIFDKNNLYIFLISYILIDASGWVISDVSFEFTGVSGLATSDPFCPNDPDGIDLTPTTIPALLNGFNSLFLFNNNHLFAHSYIVSIN